MTEPVGVVFFPISVEEITEGGGVPKPEGGPDGEGDPDGEGGPEGEEGPEGEGGPEGEEGPEGDGGPEGEEGPEGLGGPEGPGGPEGLGPEVGPVGGPEGGSVPSHFGALVVVRSMPSTQEYSRKRAIFASSVPGHSLLPKNLRVASS